LNTPKNHPNSNYEPELIFEKEIDCGENKFTISLFDLHASNESHHFLGYSLGWKNEKLFGPDIVYPFVGSNFGCPKTTPIDSNQCLKSLCLFLSLRPGEVDSEYFENYTESQIHFLDYAEEFGIAAEAIFGEGEEY
jgi:hypothetical protein